MILADDRVANAREDESGRTRLAVSHDLFGGGCFARLRVLVYAFDARYGRMVLVVLMVRTIDLG